MGNNWKIIDVQSKSTVNRFNVSCNIQSNDLNFVINSVDHGGIRRTTRGPLLVEAETHPQFFVKEESAADRAARK